jgi:hypothetical protein
MELVDTAQPGKKEKSQPHAAMPVLHAAMR